MTVWVRSFKSLLQARLQYQSPRKLSPCSDYYLSPKCSTSLSLASFCYTFRYFAEISIYGNYAKQQIQTGFLSWRIFRDSESCSDSDLRTPTMTPTPTPLRLQADKDAAPKKHLSQRPFSSFPFVLHNHGCNSDVASASGRADCLSSWWSH